MPRQTTGIISGITAALESDKPDLRVQRLVKDPALEEMFRGLIEDYGLDRRQATSTLRDFTQRYLSGIGEREGQELGAVNRYYTGEIDSLLRSIRADRMRAIEDAANRAVGYATRGRNAARIAGGGIGDSSYNRLLGSRTTADILARAAVDDSEQRRRDLETTENARLGLIGRRNDIYKARLLPYQLKSADLARRLGLVQGINTVDPGIYNIWRKRGSMEMATDILDSLAQGAFKGANAYMSFGGLGGMGGGGGKPGGGGGGGGGGGTSPSPAVYYGGSMGETGARMLGGYGGGAPAGTVYNPYSNTSDFGWGSPGTYQGNWGSNNPNAFSDWWNSSGGGF